MTNLDKLCDELAMEAWGRTRTEAKEKGCCVACGLPPESFRNEESRAEYKITLLCQKCQDELYGEAK